MADFIRNNDIRSVLVKGEGKREVLQSVPWETYKALECMNPSSIVHGTKSLWHLKQAWEAPGQVDSDVLLYGRAQHCLLFEPRDFANRYAPFDGVRRGEKWETFKEECGEEGKEALTRKAWDEVQEAARAFLRKPMVQHIVAAGQAETTLFQVEGRIQCRGRTDWISTSAGCLVDLKTCRSAAVRPASQAFYTYHYDIKLGLYQRWLQDLTGKPWPVRIVWLEKTPPFSCELMTIDNAVLDRGARKGLDILKRLETAIDDDNWPDLDDSEDYVLDTPSWEMDDELEGCEDAE